MTNSLKQTKKSNDNQPSDNLGSDNAPGWFWRTPEGKRLIHQLSAQSPNSLDNPELGNQTEED
jgi:hypothetical protein